jgi:hypothetical protein
VPEIVSLLKKWGLNRVLQMPLKVLLQNPAPRQPAEVSMLAARVPVALAALAAVLPVVGTACVY